MNTRPPDLADGYTAAWGSQTASECRVLLLKGRVAEGQRHCSGGWPERHRRSAQGFMTGFPDMTVLMDELSEHGDHAVYRWTFVGTNSGPGGTGKRVRLSGFEEWRISADGLIAESIGHFDSVEYQRQLEHGADA